MTLLWVIGLQVVKDMSSKRVGSLSVSCFLRITCPLELFILSEPQVFHLEDGPELSVGGESACLASNPKGHYLVKYWSQKYVDLTVIPKMYINS